MRDEETRRKLVHALIGLSPPLVVLILGWNGGVAAALFALAYLLLAWDDGRRGLHLPLLGAPWMTRTRNGVAGLWDGVLFMTSVTLIGLLFPLPYFFGAIALLATADSAASVVGRRWGRHPLPWNAKKSWEGFLAGALVGVPSAGLYAILGGIMSARGYGEGRSLLGPAWPWSTLIVLGVGFGALVVFFVVIRAAGWALKFSNAPRRRTMAAFLVAMAPPTAWVLTAPAFLDHPLLPLAGGHASITQLLLLLVPIPVMWVESLVNRRDNLWVPGLYATLAYGVAFVGNRL